MPGKEWWLWHRVTLPQGFGEECANQRLRVARNSETALKHFRNGSHRVPGRKLPALKSMQREAGSPSERNVATETLALDAAGPEDNVLFSLEMII